MISPYAQGKEYDPVRAPVHELLDVLWRQLYKSRSSRKIDSHRLCLRECDFPKTFSLTENQISGKTYFYTIRPWYHWQLLVHGHAQHVDVGGHVGPGVLPHSVVVRDEAAHVAHNVLGQSISSFIVRLS